MSRTISPEAVKAENIKAMGNGLGKLYTAIWNEVVWLHIKWGEYVELYGTRESRIELLNKTAPRFFRILQDIFLEDIILHISRLTDNPKSAGKENLTIQRLPKLIDDTIIEKVANKIEIAVEKSEFCRDWRNRHIAHRDLALILDEKSVEPLKSASRAKIKKAIFALDDVLNTVSQHYKNLTTIFDMFPDPDGVLSLLYVLDDGLLAMEEREKRIRNGNYRDDDFRSKDI